jgi:CRP-like cAMP-binding protein
LKQQQVLLDVGDTVATVYFPLTGVISITAPLSSGEMLDVVMIGKGGAVGIGAALGGRRSASRAVVQCSGQALTCDSATLKKTVISSRKLLAWIIRQDQRQFAEAQQSAICAASHNVEARLARMLLRMRDLSGGNSFSLTQDHIAEMLAVRRTSVSPVAQQLQSSGLITYVRGSLRILDAAGLHRLACECYDVVKRRHDHSV